MSCDNRLNKYPGGLIDHKNWNKFPPVDSSPEKMTQGKVIHKFETTGFLIMLFYDSSVKAGRSTAI